MDGWEAHIIGDGCEDFQKMLESAWYQQWIKEVQGRGNIVITENLPLNHGGHGHYITNLNINRATAQYFIFAANDDLILPGHFSHYLAGIENTVLDFVYYNTWIAPNNNVRSSSLSYGSIGHSELIVKTAFLKTMPDHSADYGHDWALIEWMMQTSALHKKSESQDCTYHVMSLPPNRTVDIID